MPPTYRVEKAYQAVYADPLAARKGERLRFERRASEWAGWLWCTNSAGQSAWVPEAWVVLEGRSCVMQRDYDATELSVESGERIAADLVESGWAWATTESGESGWVPLDNLVHSRE